MSQTGDSSNSLILQVRRANDRLQELYLADGLTIGKSEGNTICLAYDELVDRTHAKVTMSLPDGAWLNCVSDRGLLWVDGEPARGVHLLAGTNFRIGRTVFTCVNGRQESRHEVALVDAACPFCNSDSFEHASTSLSHCPNCHQPVLILPFAEGGLPFAIVPACYGSYRAEHLAGRGAMGMVLKGHDENSGRPVAIKIQLANKPFDNGAIDRFSREAVLLQQVSHPNVVGFYARGKAGRLDYLVMEWVEGKSLRDTITRHKQAGDSSSFLEALRIGEQVFEGLKALHLAGIVHRDIKPSNILVGNDGVARIADLGVAKCPKGEALTVTGNQPGTWDYMSPEQRVTPTAIDARSDQYSVGVTLYELLTGALPVGDWSLASSINSNCPPKFDKFLKRLLAPDADNRFPTTTDVLTSKEGLGQFTLARWSYRERHGALTNYFEVTNLSYYPLFNVKVTVAAYYGSGSARSFEIPIAKLLPDETARQKDIFPRVWFGGDIQYIETTLLHSQGNATLDDKSRAREVTTKESWLRRLQDKRALQNKQTSAPKEPESDKFIYKIIRWMLIGFAYRCLMEYYLDKKPKPDPIVEVTKNIKINPNYKPDYIEIGPKYNINDRPPYNINSDPKDNINNKPKPFFPRP